jgi:hypothetical protein
VQDRQQRIHNKKPDPKQALVREYMKGRNGVGVRRKVLEFLMLAYRVDLCEHNNVLC